MKSIPNAYTTSVLLLLVTSVTPVVAEDAHLSTPFVGSWQVAKPAAEGVLINKPRADCAAPVVISMWDNAANNDASDRQMLTYDSPKGNPANMELMQFNNRTTWIPEGNGPTTFIAEVKDEDSFLLYTASMGKADWDNPLEYLRCKQ